MTDEDKAWFIEQIKKLHDSSDNRDRLIKDDWKELMRLLEQLVEAL